MADPSVLQLALDSRPSHKFLHSSSSKPSKALFRRLDFSPTHPRFVFNNWSSHIWCRFLCADVRCAQPTWTRSQVSHSCRPTLIRDLDLYKPRIWSLSRRRRLSYFSSSLRTLCVPITWKDWGCHLEAARLGQQLPRRGSRQASIEQHQSRPFEHVHLIEVPTKQMAFLGSRWS